MRLGERGAAVVVAMGVVALATMAATAILVTQSMWSRRAELTADYRQAQELVQAGSDWARALLGDDRRAGSIDHLGEPWASRLPPIAVENGELVGSIVDQQGLFNLNNLVSDGKLNVTQLARFRRLLAMEGLPASLAEALADWIDADNQPQPQNGAEDEYYLALDPPYRSANRPMIDVDELALVRGFDVGVRARLAPFVTALPGVTAINVNTAPAEVLAALAEGLNLDTARMLVARRNNTYYRASADFLKQLGKGATVSDQDLCVSSDYFLASLRVTSGGAQVRGKTLLTRLNGTQWPTIVWSKYQ